MKKLLLALTLLIASCTPAFATTPTSTIPNPFPAANAPLTSAYWQTGFTAARSDINNLWIAVGNNIPSGQVFGINGDCSGSTNFPATLTIDCTKFNGGTTFGALAGQNSVLSTQVPAYTGVVISSAGSTVTTFGSFNSATLAAALTDETGTGSVVFSNSPVLTTPNIGNATGNISGNAATVTTNANLTGPITSIGNATSIASQTGSGNTFVMSVSPVLTTPNIGTATGNITGNAATVTTIPALSGDVSNSGNAVTLTPTAVTGKALTGFASTTGTVTASDSILSAIEKLWGNAQALTINLATQVTGTLGLSNGGTNATTSAGAWYNISGSGINGAKASFLAYCAAKSLTCATGDQTANLNQYFLDSQTVFYTAFQGVLNYDSGSPSVNSYIDAVVEPGSYVVSSSVYCVEHVNCVINGMLIPNSTASLASPCTATNEDGSSCGGLSTLWQPVVIAVKGSSVTGANILAHDNSGSNGRSGFADGRTWGIGAVRSVGTAGTGYTNSETGILVNPSSQTGATGTVVTDGNGHVTGFTLPSFSQFSAQNGAWTLPPALAATQYANPTFISATGVTTFGAAGAGCYIIKGQTSGAANACVYVSWIPDWCSGSSGGSGNSSYVSCTKSTSYYGLFPPDSNIAGGRYGNISITSAGTQNDTTQYGPMFGILHADQNAEQTGQFQVSGGYYNVYNTTADTRFDIDNPVHAQYGFLSRGGQQHYNQKIIDTPTASGAVFWKDQNSNTSVGLMDIFVNSSGSALSSYALDTGSFNTSGAGTMGLNLPMVYINNTGSTAEAINVDWWQGGNYINAVATNYSNASSHVNNQIGTWYHFGSNNTASHSGLLVGEAPELTGSLWDGSWPLGIGSWTWDTVANGFMGPGGEYVMWGAGVPTNGSSGIGVNKAVSGSLYIDTTNNNLYIQTGSTSSVTWTLFNRTLPHLETVTGRFYTWPGNGTSTVTNGASSSHTGVSCLPIYQASIAKPVSLAFEVTTAPTAASETADLALYADSSGVPGALIVDAGASGTGNLTITTSTTGVQIQAIASGSQTTLQPGWYWECLQITYSSSGTNAVLRSTNGGSPGAMPNQDLGWALTQGSASTVGGPVNGLTYVAPSGSITAFPSALTTWSSATYATASNQPIVWVGY